MFCFVTFCDIIVTTCSRKNLVLPTNMQAFVFICNCNGYRITSVIIMIELVSLVSPLQIQAIAQYTCKSLSHVRL